MTGSNVSHYGNEPMSVITKGLTPKRKQQHGNKLLAKQLDSETNISSISQLSPSTAGIYR